MHTPPATGFMVLHSNQLEGLRELAVSFIRRHPLPPLEPEVFWVQSNGMKHWLELALARDLGICAATELSLPSTHLWQLYRAVLGPDCVPVHMPLDKSPLVWRILRRLPALLTQTGFEPLRNYLGAQAAGDTLLSRRAYQLAVQLADVLDGYQNYRADWLDDWAQGLDQLRMLNGDSTPLPASQSWQPALWRDVLHDLSQDLSHKPLTPTTTSPEVKVPLRSRAEVHAAFLRALKQLPQGQRPAGVPQRLMVFGVTSLPMQTVQALAALGRVCQVLMLVQNPCQHHWGHIVESRNPLAKLARQRQIPKDKLPVPDEQGALSESDQYALHTQTHPLLAAWGKQGRDYLHLLDHFDDVERYQHQFQRVDVFIDPLQTCADAGTPPTALAHLQSALLHLQPLPSQPTALPDTDHSIRFVQTHSCQREVEVLHDQLLAWLDADASLQPSDIMVMVPDMTNFAPHIHAVFGRFAPGQARHIPYTVADTTPRTEALVQAIDTLLQLPQLRITRVEWQSLFEVAAVRARFGLQEHEVQQLDAWLTDAGVRWGLDAAHRQPWGIPPEIEDAPQNSWLFGLERLLLGYALGGPQVWGNTLAHAGLGGLDARWVDGLLQWLRHTQMALAMLRQDHTPQEWVAVLRQLVDLFVKPVQEADERLLERIMAPLETWLAECQLARLDSPLPLVVVREHWMAQLQMPAMQRRFFGGGVQFATLMPMRAIPFKCVCLLGMNDGEYPRQQTPRDFDLMSHAVQSHPARSHWRPGDRSRREDDRYLFLEALLSARDRLYVSWQGRRTNDHEAKPPSVLVAQLMDYLNAVWTRRNADPSTAYTAPLQPLQAFSSQYFRKDSPFQTYADDWHRAKTVQPQAYASNLATSTQPAHTLSPPSELTLSQLQQLLKQPVDVFLTDHLRLRLDLPEQACEEEEPFALSGLDKYKLNQQIAHAEHADQALAQLRLSGQLALAGFGEVQERMLLRDRLTLREPLQSLASQWPLELKVQSAQWQFGPTRLSAEWAHSPSLWRSDASHRQWLQVILRPGAVTEGKKDKQHPRLDTLGHLWVHHLAACASGTPTTSLQIGLDAAVRLSPLSTQKAQAELENLCACYAQAWLAPLPIAAQSACAYLIAMHSGHPDPMGQAQAKFEGTYRNRGEYPRSTALQRVFQRFDDLRDDLPAWAHRLYGPLLEAAQVIHLNTDSSPEVSP